MQEVYCGIVYSGHDIVHIPALNANSLRIHLVSFEVILEAVCIMNAMTHE